MAPTSFDDLLVKYVGEFGLYQKLMYIVLTVSASGVTIHNMIQIYTGAVPDFTCSLQSHNNSRPANYALPLTTPSPMLLADNLKASNQSLESQELLYINDNNYEDSPTYAEHHQCYVSLYENDTGLNAFGNNRIGFNKSKQLSKSCKHWTYNNSVYKSSITTEWNLVCSQQWLLALSQSLHMAGCLVGAVIFGDLSDRYGRRPTLLLTTVVEIITGIATSFSPNLLVYSVLRFLTGSAIAGQFNAVYLIVIEMVGPRWRVLVGLAMMYFSALGTMILAGVAYFIRDWRYLQFAISTSMSFLLVYIFIVPESPRWNSAHGRFHKAKPVLEKMARINGRSLPADIDSSLEAFIEEKKEKTMFSLLDLFRYQKLRKRILILTFIWFSVSTGYYGISLYAPNLGGNDYVNVLLSGLVEIPAYTICLWALNKIGRRTLMAISMVLAGLALIITPAFPDSLHSVRVGLALLGKLGISTALATMYPFSAEIFPTTARNKGLGLCNIGSRAGSFLAPFIITLELYGSLVVPLLVFGWLALVGGFLALLLPETRGLPLPQSLKDLHDDPKCCSKSFILPCLCRKSDKFSACQAPADESRYITGNIDVTSKESDEFLQNI